MPRLDFQTVRRSSSHAATAARGSKAAPECDWVANSSSKIRSAWANPSSTLPRSSAMGLPPTRLLPSWTLGAPGFIASTGSVTNGSGS